jgi:multidrug efflux pump subunit AcrA (membrane-fusion protein)
METYEVDVQPVADPPAGAPVSGHEKKPDTKPSVRKRVAQAVRIGVGAVAAIALAAAVANWVVVPHVLPKTTVAIANAPLAVERVSIEGEVRIAVRAGEIVKQGQPLAHITNKRLNKAPGWELHAQKENLEAELIRYNTDLATAVRLRDESRDELDKFRAALTRTLTSSLRQADSKIAEMAAVQGQAARLLALGRALSENGLSTKNDYQKALEDAAISQHRLDQSQFERQTLADQLDGVIHDVYTERDTPIYLTHYLQFKQDVASTEAKVIETRSRLEAAARQLEQTESLEKILDSDEVRSRVAGEVLRVTNTGDLGRGETVIEIAETGKAFVEAHFQDSFASSLYPGARALIKVAGMPPFLGSIRSWRRIGPAELDTGNAMKMPHTLNQLDVYIDADPGAGLSSLVGRQCRVLVANPDAGISQFPEWAAVKLFTLLGW